jgi:catechol 2,3-dioxygenase-like lactoylglutathione lyase family enzyme
MTMDTDPVAATRETAGQRWPRPMVHIGVTVPDVDRAVAWYSEILGFDVLSGAEEVRADDDHWGPGAAAVFGRQFRGMKIAQLVAGNGVGFELFQFTTPQTPAENEAEYWRPGPFHVCVRDPDIHGLARRIVESGGKQRTAPRDSYEGEPYQWCMCEDPWGNMIEIYTHNHERVFANRHGDL